MRLLFKKTYKQFLAICLLLSLTLILTIGFVMAKYTSELDAGGFDLYIEEDQSSDALYILVDKDKNPDVNGGYILFGKYPQAQADATTSSLLTTTYAQALPSNGNDNGWTSYRYYQGTGASGTETTDTDFMWYQDVKHSGKTYRGVYFTSYKPIFIYGISLTAPDGYTHNQTHTLQYYNHYPLGTVYWFEYDWVMWKIIKNNGDGSAMLLSEDVLDSSHYHTSGSCTYAESNIRNWLNNNLYHTMFSDAAKGIIKPTTVETVSDSIFLINKADTENSAFGFSDNASRLKKASNYAVCQGVETIAYNDPPNAAWMLRKSSGTTVDTVLGNITNITTGQTPGQIKTYFNYTAKLGVCPALTIDLSENAILKAAEPDELQKSIAVGNLPKAAVGAGFPALRYARLESATKISNWMQCSASKHFVQRPTAIPYMKQLFQVL